MHSHMLAALPGPAARGVGYALKLAQRAQALDQGIHLVRWTFDPLVARNAWLNLGKLGAIGRPVPPQLLRRHERRDQRRGAQRPARWCAGSSTARPGPRDTRRAVRRRRSPSAAPTVTTAPAVPRDPAGRACSPSATAVGATRRSRPPCARGRTWSCGLRPRPAPPTCSPLARGGAPRDARPRGRAVPGRPAARAAVPHELRHVHREGLRARPRRDRRRRGLGRVRRRHRPGLREECNEGAWLVLRDFLAPALFARRRRRRRTTSTECSRSCAATRWRRPRSSTRCSTPSCARGRVAGLVPGRPTRPRGCGVSVGITADDRRAARPGRRATSSEGYRRIKLKIEPGLDVERVAAVRAAHPEILLSRGRERRLHASRTSTCSARSTPTAC